MLRYSLALVVGIVSTNVLALDKQFFSIKHTEFTPYHDDGGYSAISDSIEFDSSSFRELMYQSPTDKAFSIQISGLLNAKNEFEEMKAAFDWGGIVLVASNGTIEGSFKETDEARLPGNQDPDELFQTMLPSETEFKGESQFFAIGYDRGGSIVGLGYTRTVAPVVLSVSTRQQYEFGYNPYTGKYENYHPEGTYPWEAVDAEGTIEQLGLWVRLDPFKKAFEEVGKNGQSVGELFFAADVMTGIAQYTPGDKVKEDYANATEQAAAARGRPGEGTTLEVASATSLITNRLTYATGVHGVFPIADAIVGASLGVEGTLSVNLFESDPVFGSGADAEMSTESFSMGYGFFLRVAAAY